MSTQIINRGRGPEIEGTRVTIYRIMDFLSEGSSAARMAAELELTDEQVRAAVSFIAAHRQEVEQEYAKILERVQQPNPAGADVGKARSAEELKKRILARTSRDLSHVASGRQ
jgi:uncharacterized protein (DUF433 family)